MLVSLGLYLLLATLELLMQMELFSILLGHTISVETISRSANQLDILNSIPTFAMKPNGMLQLKVDVKYIHIECIIYFVTIVIHTLPNACENYFKFIFNFF
jgi:hypothetical protein